MPDWVNWEIILPPKETKPIHSVYGKALGYRCPICKFKGYETPPSCLYGGTSCKYCSGSGRIINKKLWLYVKMQLEMRKYEERGFLPSYFQFDSYDYQQYKRDRRKK